MEQKGAREEQIPEWWKHPEAQKIRDQAFRKIARLDLLYSLLVPIAGLFCGAAVGFIIDYRNGTFYLFTLLIGAVGLVLAKALMDQQKENEKRFWNSLSEDQRTEYLMSQMQKHRKK
jgi:hypothetical protein